MASSDPVEERLREAQLSHETGVRGVVAHLEETGDIAAEIHECPREPMWRVVAQTKITPRQEGAPHWIVTTTWDGSTGSFKRVTSCVKPPLPVKKAQEPPPEPEPELLFEDDPVDLFAE